MTRLFDYPTDIAKQIVEEIVGECIEGESLFRGDYAIDIKDEKGCDTDLTITIGINQERDEFSFACRDLWLVQRVATYLSNVYLDTPSKLQHLLNSIGQYDK